MLQVKIIADSEFDGIRLTTFEVEFWRFILPELNTHRVFSRNYQSSRAVPVKALIEQVRNDPAMPVHWGANQSGMTAKSELTGDNLESANFEWKQSAQNAALAAECLMESGLHKQVANRVLEPYMWTRGVITATKDGFDSFFALRCHEDAQPEIRALADEMKEKYNQSVPIELGSGDWHMPYYDSGHNMSGCWLDNDSSETSRLVDAVKISTSCVAQVSYRKLDDSIEKANKIYDMLNLPSDGVFSENPPHFSPAEHCAMAFNGGIGGNFNTSNFFQYRKMLELGIERRYIN